jgi:cysteine desulfurase/selenocysteine lyase
MKALNIKGTIRVSLAFYNDKKDIDAFIKALKKAISLLKG